ncbi:MAG: insulinase family protein, partial [Anaplasmataceae bacterium]|nr:insulinase family protein [Anaplasmataceae bacterium]
MKNIKYLIIFFGILYASHAFSENDYDIKILPEIYKSKSGIEFIIHEKHNSEIITMNLYFKNSGYIYEKDNQKGISTLATILLKKYATTNIGIDEFSKHLFKKGIVINFSNYADGIIMDVMCLSHDLSETLDYVTMLIGENKKIDGNLFKNTKKILIENIENETKNINYIAYKELTNALLNTADPYYESIEHNIEKITRNDINNFIDSHFSLNNVIISVAGDINKKDFRDILDKHLILSKKSDKINIKHLDHSNIFNEKKE